MPRYAPMPLSILLSLKPTEHFVTQYAKDEGPPGTFETQTVMSVCVREHETRIEAYDSEWTVRAAANRDGNELDTSQGTCRFYYPEGVEPPVEKVCKTCALWTLPSWDTGGFGTCYLKSHLREHEQPEGARAA